jgi:2,3-bisphosphoglycerate-dependent phosphoglycerate mutase
MEFSRSFIILRHGQSQWNLENRFTGWTDIALTEKGRMEASQAGDSLRQAGCTFDIAFTSVLDRAIDTLDAVLKQLNNRSIPVRYSWRLNERHYGCLQGLNKADTARRLGLQLVMSWRRSYSVRPPALELDDRRHPRFDGLYQDLSAADLPVTESLEDTEQRLMPLWDQEIKPSILEGQRVLIVAHGNSLRALVRYLDQIAFAEVPALNIPTGVPIIYQTDPQVTIFQRRFFPSNNLSAH